MSTKNSCKGSVRRRRIRPVVQCDQCGSDFEIFRLDRVGKARFCSRSCSSSWLGARRPKTLAALQAGRKKPGANERRLAALAVANAKPDAVAKRSAAIKAAYARPGVRAARQAQLAALRADRTVERKRIASLKRGAEHPAYRDGSGSKQRPKAPWRQWRTAVFQRDSYTCQNCGQRGGELQADHIKPYSEFPDLRWDINNGRTLCVPCHRLTPTYGRKQAKRLQALQCEGVGP